MSKINGIPAVRELERISDDLVRIIYETGHEEMAVVIRLKTRAHAIALAESATRKALKRDNAYECLEMFHNDFTSMPNYEIEMYLDELQGGCHRIQELCPFNNFTWFDNQ